MVFGCSPESTKEVELPYARNVTLVELENAPYERSPLARSTSYPVMGEPPFPAGGVHVTFILENVSAMAARPVGAPGAVPGVPAAAGFDGGLDNIANTA